MVDDDQLGLILRAISGVEQGQARIEARLEQALAGLEAKLEARLPRSEYEARHAHLEQRITHVESDIAALESKVDQNEQRRSDAARDVNVKAWAAIATAILGIIASLITWLIIGA